MSPLLREASALDPSSVKAGFFGETASGKTLTSGLLALGLSLKLHNGAPVCISDAENAARFLAPIYALEGVRLLTVPSHTFIDMRDGLTEAEHAGCCVYLVDNYSLAHKELVESAKIAWNVVGRQMPYPLREELDRHWGDWVRQFKDSPLHVLLNGRLGFTWEEVADDAGDPRFVKLETKMRGERDMGYEPDLLVEMDALRDSLVRDKRTKTKQGQIKHAAVVLKDRWRELNGKTFVWKDLNSYAKGHYEIVCRDFWPHVLAQTRGSDARVVRGESVARSSGSLFTKPSSESQFARDTQRRTIAIEEIQAALTAIWPGSTQEEKRLKHVVMQTVFKSRSWEAVGSMTPEALETAWLVMRHFEAAALDINVRDEAAVVDLIQSCKDLEAARTEASVL